jgi:hypothetical protein
VSYARTLVHGDSAGYVTGATDLECPIHRTVKHARHTKNRRASWPAGEHYFFFAVFFLAVAFVPHFFPQAIDFTSLHKK